MPIKNLQTLEKIKNQKATKQLKRVSALRKQYWRHTKHIVMPQKTKTHVMVNKNSQTLEPKKNSEGYQTVEEGLGFEKTVVTSH